MLIGRMMKMKLKSYFNLNPKTVRKFSWHLVRAKRFSFKPSRSYRYGRNKNQFTLNANQTNSFTITSTSIRLILCLITVKKYLIHLLTNQTCFKQYVGKTMDKFR